MNIKKCSKCGKTSTHNKECQVFFCTECVYAERPNEAERKNIGTYYSENNWSHLKDKFNEVLE